MILTESDLHAYNRGELSPEATRQLESDPLAMQDAARLRAIGSALRAEQPIFVLGRSETIDRLRAKSVRGVGTPRWVWGVGLASVAGLILVSIPPEPSQNFRITRAMYELPAGESRLTSDSEFESKSRVKDFTRADAAQESAPLPSSSGATASASAVASPAPGSRARIAPELPVTLRVPDVEAAQAKVRQEAKALGARIIESDQTSSTRDSLQIETERPAELRERLLTLGRPIGEAPIIGAQVREEQARSPLTDRSSAAASAPSFQAAKRPSSVGRLQGQRAENHPRSTIVVNFVAARAPAVPLPAPWITRSWLRLSGLVILVASLLILLAYRLVRRR